MFICSRGLILFLAVTMLGLPVTAAEVSKEELKSLDEQVQDIKSDALRTGSSLLQLEEKLLYPSSTQIAVYVSLDSAATYRLDTIEVRLNGNAAAQHLYTVRELEALQKGGMQRVYAGNLRTGDHSLEVIMTAKALGGDRFREKERFKFTKDTGAKVVEVRLVAAKDRPITFREW